MNENNENKDLEVTADSPATEEEIQVVKPARKAPPKKSKKQKEREARAIRGINRFIGFLLTTVVLIGVLGLGVEYVLVKGPSPALRDTFVMTMLETRRFGFIPKLFLSNEEVEQIRSRNANSVLVEATDPSLINLPGTDGAGAQEGFTPEDYGLVDEDGDGIIIEEIKNKSYSGYMVIVLDPNRVFVGKPDYYGGYGLTVEAMCQKYDALGGINGGGFVDDGGGGLGGEPTGLTVVDGVYFNEWAPKDIFIGFDVNGILHIGWMDAQDARAAQIRDGVTFPVGPILVSNGNPLSTASSVNPRTAIGQRGDGAVLLLVIDGRQAHSVGCTYDDLTEIMMNYGAVNACNLDGGSSTVLWYDGDYLNSPAAVPRPLPTGFLFR